MARMRTPGVVIGAASIMFVHAALLMICVGCAGIGLVAKDPNDALGIEAMLDKEAPGHTAVGIGDTAFKFLFSLLLIACGIGVLFLSNIARIGAYLTCMAIPIESVATTIYNVIVIFPVQQRIMQQQFQGLQQPGGPNIDFAMIMRGSAALSILLAVGIPVLFCLPVFILLTMKSARRAFAGEPAESAPAPEEDRPARSFDDDDDYRAPRDRRAPPPDTGIQS